VTHDNIDVNEHYMAVPEDIHANQGFSGLTGQRCSLGFGPDGQTVKARVLIPV
jgi:hypothetical protein